TDIIDEVYKPVDGVSICVWVLSGSDNLSGNGLGSRKYIGRIESTRTVFKVFDWHQLWPVLLHACCSAALSQTFSLAIWQVHYDTLKPTPPETTAKRPNFVPKQNRLQSYSGQSDQGL